MSTDYSELTGDYTIDASHSRMGFVARHAMIAKVRGGFDGFEGSAYIDGTKPENSTAQVTIQAKCIDSCNKQRDDHLCSNDFLDMDNHPQIIFVSTTVVPAGDDHFTVTGDLTIRGVTKSVDVDFEYTGRAVDPFGNERLGFEGSVVLNRKDFGVDWNAALEGGGVLVSEKVTLEIEVSAIKNS